MSTSLIRWIQGALGGSVFEAVKGEASIEVAAHHPTRSDGSNSADGETLRPSAVTAVLVATAELALSNAAPRGLAATVTEVLVTAVKPARGQFHAVVDTDSIAALNWEPGRTGRLQVHLVTARGGDLFAVADVSIALDQA